MPLENTGKVIVDRHKDKSFATGSEVALQTEIVGYMHSNSVTVFPLEWYSFLT